MAYATQQDIIDRVGEDALAAVADRDGDTTVEAEAITSALDDASAEIDSYLSTRYPLPLASTPATVKRTCADIAMYHLSGNRTTDEVEKRYNNAIRWLRDLAKGAAGLGEHPAEEASAGASFSAGPRIANRDGLKGGF